MKRKRKSAIERELPEFLQPLPIIEFCCDGDWQKEIRSEISRYKEYFNQHKNKKAGSPFACLDFEKSLEKRRIRAMLSYIESLSYSNAVIQHWITLNVVTHNYSPLDSEYHIMTAAAIWVLDQIRETDIPMSELYKLLPRDDALLEDLYAVDVCDTQFSDELIASVEYVLRNRNSDIAPPEDDGMDGKRVFTSILAAEGKTHADVPSRNNYEALIGLIPQSCIDAAVAEFETCFKVFHEHFFTLASYLCENEENKRNALNAHRKKMNAERERAVRWFNKSLEEYKRKRDEKSSPLMNPLTAHNLSKISQLALPSDLPLSASFSNFSMEALSEDNSSFFERLEQLDIEHDALVKEFEQAMGQSGIATSAVSENGYISKKQYTQFFSGLDPSVLEPLPVSDPFALCFALLYLIEKDSDIPWLYGSCLSMMREVVESLPWAHFEFDELDDEHWFDISNDDEPRRITIAEAETNADKRAAFPDWYSRDYRWKGEERCEARNLAQILYEETGCLMPRNLHRYDMELTYLGKYGLKQNKALSMLYCMVALGTRRKQLSALNLDIGYMSEFEEKQESVIEKVQDADALKAEIEKLRKEGQQLRSALHSAEKTNNDLRKKLSKLQEQSKAEHRELSDLREIVFKSDTPEPEETEEISTVEFPYTVLKTTVVFGGHDTWVKAIRPLLKGDIKFVPREMKIDVSLVKNADVIWIQTNAIPHRSYYSIVDTARKYRKPIRYFTFASASKCANQVVCNDII